MGYVAIDAAACVQGFINACVADIGSDPQGWDKSRTDNEHAEFMKVSNHELSIERLECGAALAGNADDAAEV